MASRKLGRSAPGQGLAEYALILALVAIVAVAIIGLAGLAVARNYGILAAVFGAKQEVTGIITFNYFPRCGYVTHQGTGLYAEIQTNNIPIGDLTVSTDTGFVTVLTDLGGGKYAIQPNLTHGADINDLSLCPHGLVVQTSQAYGGKSALYPVTIQSWN